MAEGGGRKEIYTYEAPWVSPSARSREKKCGVMEASSCWWCSPSMLCFAAQHVGKDHAFCPSGVVLLIIVLGVHTEK